MGLRRSRKSTSGEPRGLTQFVADADYAAAVRRLEREFDADRYAAAASLVEILIRGLCPGAIPEFHRSEAHGRTK